MALYNIAFYGAIFFLTGILLSSAGFSMLPAALITVLAALTFYTLYFFNKKKQLLWLAILAMSVILGSAYYVFDDSRFTSRTIPAGAIETTGTIVSDPERGSGNQSFIFQFENGGRILVRTARFPEFAYGDYVSIQGSVKKPKAEYARILAKDRVAGLMSFADVQKIEAGRGSFIKRALFTFKNKAIAIFPKILPPEKAAFLAGITLGERAQFSEEFEEAMSLSGTTHLVALSGYNVTIIGLAIGATLGQFLRRRSSFVLTVLVITGFVFMTGAEASIVRAAIMGVIVLIANQVNRLYHFRNAITFAALLMALFNPKVLVFDVGFQLSFLALLGIVYFRPAIIKMFRISTEPGFFSWRENALTTVSAQLAVLPLLLSNFGTFSLSSFAANILILSAIPITMLFGFLIMAAGFLSYYVALVLGWIANIFLSYEVGLIRFFSQLTFLVLKIYNFTHIFSLLYFILIIIMIWYAQKRITY